MARKTGRRQRRAAVLDLAEKPERPLLRIAGKDYEMRHPQEVGLRDFVRIQRKAKEVEGLGRAGEDLTEEDADRLAASLDELVRIVVVDLPEEVHGMLTDLGRMKILNAFTHTQLDVLAEKGAEAEKTATPAAGDASTGR